MKDTAYFYLTPEGKVLVEKLAAARPGDIYGKENFKEKLRQAFTEYEYLVCVMATGIVVRILAPLLVHKTSDPGVVVLDQKGMHAISLLSGHLGGANDLAREMARISGGTPVITTATDVAGELSFDIFAKKYDMAIENIGSLKRISGALLAGEKVLVITDRYEEELEREAKAGKLILANPSSYKEYLKEDLPCVVIHEGLSLDTSLARGPVLYLRPRSICAGIGCKRNMEAEPIEAALRQVFEEEGLSPLSLKCISTIPLKADEAGIITTAAHMGVPLQIIPTEEIEKLDIKDLGIQESEFVAKQTGVVSVSTASSYLAARKGKILRDKAKFKGITVALSKIVDNAPIKKSCK